MSINDGNVLSLHDDNFNETDINIQKFDNNIRWDCYLHKNNNCFMSLYKGEYFHIISIKQLSQYAATLNKRNESDEFWESFGKTTYVCPIANINLKKNPEFIINVFELFNKLDAEGIYLMKSNKPDDFVRRHIISSGDGQVTICNRHLFHKKSNKPYKSLYSTIIWKKKLIKALFPGIIGNKRKLSPDIPSWVYNI